MLRVKLINYTQKPLETLYAAYRTCYSKKSPIEIWQELETLDSKKVEHFIIERLKTHHNSPLEQVIFWFGVEGFSRVASHQLIRHRIGISFEQQSQRYVQLHGLNPLENIEMPKTWQKSALSEEFKDLIVKMFALYKRAIEDDIPVEDARFILPQASKSNLQICVNLAELLHIADLRLCLRAQWEIRKLVSLMRREVRRVMPLIGGYMQPKCKEFRQGFCDEPYDAYMKCPLRKVRPHKEDLFKEMG